MYKGGIYRASTASSQEADMRVRSLTAVFVALNALLLPAAAGAQQGGSAIRGRVTDEQHAVLPGVAIVVTHEESGAVPDRCAIGALDTLIEDKGHEGHKGCSIRSGARPSDRRAPHGARGGSPQALRRSA